MYNRNFVKSLRKRKRRDNESLNYMAEISQGTCIVEKTELTCGHYARCPDKSSSISSVVP